MGSGWNSANVKDQSQQIDQENSEQPAYCTRPEKALDVDVIEVSNIALAIKHNELITNLQFSISIKDLPPTKAFEQINTQVVLYKVTSTSEIEIGRTQCIKNELNPKFLQTFMVPYNSQKTQQVIFKVYNLPSKQSQKLNEKYLVGQTRQTLKILHECEYNELKLELQKRNTKERAIIKVHCTEYDDNNQFYETEIQVLSNFKNQLYYIILILKQSQWFPVKKSNIIQSKKYSKFESVKMPVSKFVGDESSRIKIKLIEINKSKQEEEVGCTEQIIVKDLDQKETELKLFKEDGFSSNSIRVNKWKKNKRNSFITYIVTGARLNLILGIDFSNSNFEGSQPLHNSDDEKNQYIHAIRQIVGLLQYFDNYNQIAIYGFGAQLPPYYRSVGHCFALNDNFFSPTITGGVEQIIKLYKKTLKKIKPHGPSKISQILDIAIQYAQSQYQSTNYYVLILLSDGQINDYNDAVEKVIQASSLPLSIVFVGLGDKDFGQLQKLDQDKELLKSTKTEAVCERDMFDFIKFREEFSKEKNFMNEINIARKTFSELPMQYIDYMQRKNEGRQHVKKSLKAAKMEFISTKIKQLKQIQKMNKQKEYDDENNADQFEEKQKQISKDGIVVPQIEFLKEKKKAMKRQLLTLGFDIKKDKDLNIAMNDINYFIEIFSSKKQSPKIEKKNESYVISFKQERKFEEYLQKKEQDTNKKIQKQLYKRQTNQYGKRRRIIQKQPLKIIKKTKKLKNPCLKCKQHEITILHVDCGHLAVCEFCQQNICYFCKNYNEELIQIDDASSSQN